MVGPVHNSTGYVSTIYVESHIHLFLWCRSVICVQCSDATISRREALLQTDLIVSLLELRPDTALKRSIVFCIK